VKSNTVNHDVYGKMKSALNHDVYGKMKSALNPTQL